MRAPELFQPEVYINPKWYLFKEQDLGKIHGSIPWDELEACLPKENFGPGAKRWFSGRGMLGLMFLKSILNVSDKQLIDRFNTDWSLQLFCNKLLKENERIKDYSIVSRIRTYLSEEVEWEQLQRVLLDYWKRDMDNTHVLLMDATCYESYVRFPTDVKLLWESCQWIYEKQLFKLCKKLRIKRPRSKYVEQKRKQLDYSRRRKKGYKLGRKRKQSLLYLLEKGIGLLQEVLDQNPEVKLPIYDRHYLRTIKKVLEQQTFLQTHPAKELKNRIVSLHKPYLRPIVRGKENKRVEFGMKAHVLQVDGICFIDTLEFRAFNESTRLKISYVKHKNIFGELNHLGADRIYATNANRRYLTSKQVFTCFPKKGPKVESKEEKKLKSLISIQRSTVMEGAFGTQKTAYGLNKVRARGEKREKLWVFFGIMAANSVKISKRKPPEQLSIAA